MSVRIWDVQRADQHIEFLTDDWGEGEHDWFPYYFVTFSPDGSRIAISNPTPTIRILTYLLTGEEQKKLDLYW